MLHSRAVGNAPRRVANCCCCSHVTLVALAGVAFTGLLAYWNMLGYRY